MNDLRMITAMIYAGRRGNTNMFSNCDLKICIKEAQAIIDATPDPVDIKNHGQCANANNYGCPYGSEPFAENQTTMYYCKGCNTDREVD